MGLIGVAFAKIEARKIKRRLRRSHPARAELGKPVGGTHPFGWKDDRLTLDPIEVPLLAKAIEQFIVGRSMGSIVREGRPACVSHSATNGDRLSTPDTKESPRLWLAQARRADVADIRRRRFTSVEKGSLDMPEKRTYIREALHAVIVKPAG